MIAYRNEPSSGPVICGVSHRDLIVYEAVLMGNERPLMAEGRHSSQIFEGPRYVA